MSTPEIECCFEGIEAVNVVRAMAGATNGRNALPGTIRGDYCMSNQQNIVHTSDSLEKAKIELARFFKPEEIFEYEFIERNSFHSRSCILLFTLRKV